MKPLVEVCLVAVILAGGTTFAAAQSAAEIPLQRGITVDLPVASNAVVLIDADREDATVLTVTHDGRLYLGVDQTDITGLAEKVRNAFSNRGWKTLYIKADARIPYASLIRILDSVRTAGVQGVTLLTAARDAEKPGTLVPPKGLEMLMVAPH